VRIDRIRLKELRNDAHFQFHCEVKAQFTSSNVAQLFGIKDIVDNYCRYVQVEDESLKKVSKSALTPQIREADKQRAQIFSGLAEYNSAMCKHFNPKVKAAANNIQVVFDMYGNIAKKPQNEQISAFYNIIQELCSKKYEKDVDTVGIRDWVSELERRNVDTAALMRTRYSENASRAGITVKKARVLLDSAYQSIIEKIEALTVVEGSAKYDAFIQTINAIISAYGGRSNNYDDDFSAVIDESIGVLPPNSSANSTPSNSGDVGGGSHGGGQNGGISYEPQNYDPNKHYTLYSVGDLVKMPNGDVYRVMNLSHVHFAPDSENGHYSWDKV